MDDRKEFDLRDFLPYLLNRAAERTSLGFQRIYKERYGMLRTEWRILFHLGRYEEMTATEICARSGIHKTKASRAVKALEQRRFLTRKQRETDRRHETLALTNAGRTAYLDLSRIAASYDRELAGQFTPEEQAVLLRSLKRLAGV